MLNSSLGVGSRQSVKPPVFTVAVFVTAFSQVLSPLSVFCQMSPVTLSVIVPLPLSVNDCGLIE